MSEIMRNPPIFYTAAQIRFNPVLDMDDSISRIQRLWRSKFPDFTHQPLNQVQMQLSSSGDAPTLKVNAISRWHFKDIDGTTGLMLTTDSLVFHTTNYSTSQQFIDTLVNALTVVDEAVSLAYVEAVGFRTLDAVVPSADRQLDFYLQPGLLGLSSSLEGTLKHSVFELSMQQAQIQLTSRCIIQNGKLGLPMDLFPISLKLKGEVQTIDGIHAVLDNDATYAERFSFNIEDVSTQLRNIKSAISKAFYGAITPSAIREWNNPNESSS